MPVPLRFLPSFQKCQAGKCKSAFNSTSNRHAFTTPSWSLPTTLRQYRHLHRTCASKYDVKEIKSQRKTLQKELELAIKSEDYATAAKLKQELDNLNASDPLLTTQMELQKAVTEERYEDAARLSQKLKELRAELGAAAVGMVGLSTSSEAVTRGVRVRVQSTFLPSKSNPAAGNWFYAYRVTIINEGDQVVQLRNRHWIFTDTNGHVDEVRGPGVVGEQPVLLPNARFEYTSGVPLRTPKGTMEGDFMMVVLNQATEQFGDRFEATVAKLLLSDDGTADL